MGKRISLVIWTIIRLSASPCYARSPADQTGFWNYFQLGLDFLVSESGVVEKIIAHSNIVSHAWT